MEYAIGPIKGIKEGIVSLSLLLILSHLFLVVKSNFKSTISPSMAMSLTIRPAKSSDVDALTQIGIAAFPLEPQWPYRYPYRHQYPEDHIKHTRNRYTEWLSAAATPTCEVVVAEAPSLEDPEVRKVVSLSIWRLPTQYTDTEDCHKCS
jgi:hypothetical protein